MSILKKSTVRSRSKCQSPQGDKDTKKLEATDQRRGFVLITAIHQSSSSLGSGKTRCLLFPTNTFSHICPLNLPIHKLLKPPIALLFDKTKPISPPRQHDCLSHPLPHHPSRILPCLSPLYRSPSLQADHSSK